MLEFLGCIRDSVYQLLSCFPLGGLRGPQNLLAYIDRIGEERPATAMVDRGETVETESSILHKDMKFFEGGVLLVMRYECDFHDDRLRLKQPGTGGGQNLLFEALDASFRIDTDSSSGSS